MRGMTMLLMGVILCAQLTCEQEKKSSEVTGAIEEQPRKRYDFQDVSFDNLFDGARLNGVRRKNDSVFTVTILPENTPVNQSPWYAFRVYSKTAGSIFIELVYPGFKHRYIPKMSTNGTVWQHMQPSQLQFNHDKTTCIFPISLKKDTLWVSAQEIESSNASKIWMDSILKEHSFIKQEIAGKSVRGKDIFVMVHEPDKIKRSVVLIARQHPPEVPGGTIAFRAFYGALLSHSDLARKFRRSFNMYTFPLLNPDGADLGHWRHNANGSDLNRDWEEFKQPETQAARDFIKSRAEEYGRSIMFGLDFHTSHSGPYLLILDSINESRLRTQIIPQWTQKIGNQTLTMEYRRRSQDLPYCYNWFYNAFDAEAVTYEAGDEINRQEIKARAQLYAEKWMETLLTTISQ